MEIVLKDVSVTYMQGTPFAKKALERINVHIPTASITGLIGHTGSGKSTLVLVIAGLILPTNGTIQVGSFQWSNKKRNLFQLRKHIGVVFQYPEHQLFAETVEKDISFGLKNLGIDNEQLKLRVKEAMESVKLPYDIFKDISPFKLSGGQMKRVALAGVLAQKPDIIILDEPTAGLDATGKQDVLSLLEELREQGKTIIIVSHSMDEIAGLSDRLIVLNQGKIEMEGTPEAIFSQEKRLAEINLDLPDITKLIVLLNKELKPAIPLKCFKIDELEEQIIQRLKGKKQ